ncbi:SMI1/KNR4 family protein [Fusobacterium polymorphum]|uniref:SMI1/KNR4 family protein n=1 Tax=Fusobacterium nucleatum subsp. polymorphum TaxID=76857 RepID=UPI001C6E9C2F|nr:SMI1/KNR4 family protein [Fusobacterium polymorphum]QYR62206.1 SMI1/KNR4 family protein [Fusobacterium polymorphum]
MNIVEKIKKMKDLDINPKGGASKEQIERAEKRLNLKFSEEYKEYLKEFGAISFFGNEWSGLNIDGYFNVVNMTEDEKALNEVFPEKYFAIENLAVDGIIIISNEEGKIYSIQYDKKELICNSLSEYLDICLKRN